MTDREYYGRIFERVAERLMGFLLSIILCGLLTLLLGSCITKKTVVDRYTTDTLIVVEKDTIRLVRADTVRDVRMVTNTDTIRELVTRVVTLREKGDTVRDVVEKEVYRYIYRGDSTDRYRSVADSLQAIINKMSKESKTKTVTKEVVKTKSLFPGWLQVILIGIFVFSIIVIARDLSKRTGGTGGRE